MDNWPASPFTGVFTRFDALSPRAHDPATALASGLAAPWLEGHEAATASGIGWTDEAARAACVGEAIERLQACPLPGDGLIRTRFDAWPRAAPAVDPETWVLFHLEQYASSGFPFQPLCRDTLCDWVAFRDAATGTPVWVPAELAYLHLSAGQRHCPGYSTGLASGRHGDPVLLRGLQEVIERDAVMGAWWGRYPLEEHPRAAALATEFAGRVCRPNLAYRNFRIDTPYSDHVTLVTLEGEDREGYCFSVGSSCRETRAASWEKSLLEAIHCRHYVRRLKSQVAEGLFKVGPAPTSFAEHAVFYSIYPQRLRETVLKRPLFQTTTSDDATREGLDQLLARLGPRRPALFRSMTPPAFASQQMGWQVLRVVVPGLQPLHGHHGLAHLGGPLWSPRRLADWAALPPHPFP